MDCPHFDKCLNCCSGFFGPITNTGSEYAFGKMETCSLFNATEFTAGRFNYEDMIRNLSVC